MRVTISLFCLVTVLFLTAPAQAQLRDDPAPSTTRTQLYDSGANVFDKLFSDEHFKMGHTYEMSMSSFGGQTASMGMYTNSMMWQFNSDWAARVDLSVAHPFSQSSAFGQQDTRVFLRNAEVAYRPSENMEFRFQIQQSPYGRYASPYGRYRPGFQSYGRVNTHTPTSQLFWRN